MRLVKQLLVAATLAVTIGTAQAGPNYQIIDYGDLLGWETDNHAEALAAFLQSCQDISAIEWAPICEYAATNPSAKGFFETLFIPVVVSPDHKALFTGYFEPELDGSLYKVGKYQYPIYTKPKNLTPKDPELTRAEIDNGALKHKGLEIAYVDDPVEAYYLHIQGSGRINLTNGNTIRVGYAGENGHVYRSAAGEMVRKGLINLKSASIGGIRAWVKRNPEQGIEALQHNASYVFFRRLKVSPTDTGPRGALDRPITAMRSIAVDPKFVQLGAPVWIEKGGLNTMRRLMIAQDVGSVIKGPQRADIFFGTGVAAGKLAGQTKDSGRMVVLLPVAIAHRLVPEN
ncbi:MAG: membrane-bound lytic murein transglycosylase A [Paracoccaceae bacterium]|jgi:membrane-bound lytic murein transglycosylase A